MTENNNKNQTESFNFKEFLPNNLKDKEKEDDEEESTEMKSNEENGGQNEELYRIEEINKAGIQ